MGNRSESASASPYGCVGCYGFGSPGFLPEDERDSDDSQWFSRPDESALNLTRTLSPHARRSSERRLTREAWRRGRRSSRSREASREGRRPSPSERRQRGPRGAPGEGKSKADSKSSKRK